MITVDLIWKKTLTVLFSAILPEGATLNETNEIKQTNKQTNIKQKGVTLILITIIIFVQKQSLGVKFKERKMHGFFNDLVSSSTVCTVIL